MPHRNVLMDSFMARQHHRTRLHALFGGIVALILAGVLLSFQWNNASASQNPPGSAVNNMTFYAYIEAGESLDIEFIRVSGSGTANISIQGPGGVTNGCIGVTTCSLSGLDSSETGIWSIEIDGSSGNDGFTWTINVLDDNDDVIDGRVWTEYYNMRDSSAHGPFTFWNLGEHGYLYQATYGSGYLGINSIFLVDGTGVRYNDTCVSAYASVVHSTQVGETIDPDRSVTSLGECGDPYKQFFELPDPSMPQTALRWDGTEDWMYPLISTPAINNITFTPDSTVIRSGEIVYEVTGFSGQLMVEIDTNTDGTYDVQIPGFATDGMGSVIFDGIDGNGNLVPALRDISLRVVIDRVGEAHFTNIDVEVRVGGLEVIRLNGPDAPDPTIYWNDTELDPNHHCGNGPVIIDGRSGVDSTGGTHEWDVIGCSGVSGGWGDARAIDDWAYVPVDLEETLQVAGDELPPSFPVCDARAFHGLAAGNGPTEWYALDLVTGDLELLRPALGENGDLRFNGFGYSIADDRIYGPELVVGGNLTTGYLVVVGGDNVGQRIGPVPGLENLPNLNTGDISPDGLLYATNSDAANPTIYVIDVDPSRPTTYLTIVDQVDRVADIDGNLSVGWDWVYHPADDLLYSVRGNALLTINPTSGQITVLGALIDTATDAPLVETGGLGGMFLDSSGFLYAYRNATGSIYRINLDDATATLFATGIDNVGNNDGARCANAPIPIDFGDAPASYGTLLSDNGARHGVPLYDASDNTAPLMLGEGISIESDGQPHAAADADTFDDGVVFNPALNLPGNVMVTQAGEVNTVVVEVVGEGYLSAWIDLNNNGVFDPEERIFNDEFVVDGENILTFSVPDTVPHGATFARFRLTSQPDVANVPTGPAPDGEVEDYLVYVAAPVPLTCDAGLINSGFEVPNVSGGTPPALDVFAGGSIKIYHENVVPGWSFTASDPNSSAGGSVPPEDQRNSIELWRTTAPPAYEGDQFAEINAYVFGFLYQDMVTIPGTTLSWQFAHRGRLGEDTIALRIGPPGAVITQTIETTGNTAWQVYGGEYIVPADQHITRFEFVAVDTADGNQAAGNFLDAVSFGLLCDPELLATKQAELEVDADDNGVVSPGDTLRYTVVISNSGLGEALNAVFTDSPDVNTTLVPGSVTTSQGSITSGNTAGDVAISIDLGNIPVDGSVTITYDVLINNPLPPGVTQVSNQGLVSVDNPNVPDVPTEDPDTPECCDPTNVPVTAAPILNATKQATLHVDADDSGAPSPGDTLLYTVVIDNSGNRDALDVSFTDTPDANTTLVPGSVTTSQGSITSGNDAGDSTIVIDLGTIPGGGGEVVITFQVVINNPLPPGVTEVVNQGIVTSPDPDVPDLFTEDPDTPECCDPTNVPVTAAPILNATKQATLHVDADDSGAPSPGDTLLYTVVIDNSGNRDALDVSFTDSPDANTTLVPGSVTTSQGSITSGNDAGDSTIVIDLGTIPGGGGEVVITFQVVINNPLPPGVTEVVNQGIVTSPDPDVPDLPTNDPNVPGCCNPTEVPVDARPRVDAFKAASLHIDADANGVPSPGDTLLYTVRIINSGNQATQERSFTDSPDANTTLVPGSVTTSQGNITSGNDAGDSTITVQIGSIPGNGGEVEITFQVVINNPLPAGVTEVVNQGIVSGDDPNEPDIPTNDPNTPGCCDPTEVPIDARPRVSAYKSSILYQDADNSGTTSPGDTLLYTIIIRNSGNQATSSLNFTDLPDPHTQLVVGSVGTSQGSVTTGNSAGDTSIAVDIGSIPGGGGEVTISFRVVIDNPLPTGVDTIANQGIVSSDDPNVPDVPTSDPNTPECCDPTETPVDATPRIQAYKRVNLYEDADGNTFPSPGDTLVYSVRIVNSGNQAATGLVFTDTPDANTQLIVGSVSSDRGTIFEGNSEGNSRVGVDIGTLPGGAEVIISFRVRIDDPLPADVDTIDNQGIVFSDDPRIPDTLTDDPTTPQQGDPTETPVDAAPRLRAFKQVTVLEDADGNGMPSPGDTLLYNITLRNTGNQAATELVFTDTPDANTTLVAGSVASSRGTIITGNNPGDDTIVIDIGTLPGGGREVSISFRVVIVNPLPAGTQAVVNQGVLSSNDPAIDDVLTDDPTTAQINDPTSTHVVASPRLSAAKSATIFHDAQETGSLTRGDTLLYTIRIENTGNTAATGLVFTDTPDANTMLLAGTVRSSRGTIITGNNEGDTSIAVNIGTLPAGESVNITLRVLINESMPSDAEEVINQGVLANDMPDVPEVLTSDPQTAAESDPTVIGVGPTPPTSLNPETQPGMPTDILLPSIHGGNGD